MKIVLKYHPIRSFWAVFNKKSYKYLLYYKILCAVVLYNFASSVISVGDTGLYLSGASGETYSGSTAFMHNVGAILMHLNYNTVNFFCAVISAFFIVKVLEDLQFKKYTYWLVYCMLFIPSFTLYSSIFSKEFFCVIASCLCVISLIRLITTTTNKFDWSTVWWGGLFIFFKPQYLIAISHIYLIILLYKYYFKNHVIWFNLICICICLIDAWLLMHFADVINSYFLNFGIYFAGGNTTRIIYGDFFDNLFMGLFMGFFGSTIPEVMNNSVSLANMYSVIESSINWVLW